jgi:hypothetical protein
MSTYDTSHGNPFRHHDGSTFNISTDTLDLTDLYVTARGRLMPVQDALKSGHLLPSVLIYVATKFNPQIEWGAMLTRDIAPAPWAGVRIGQTAATTGTEKRRAKKDTKPTHASMCALRNMMGKQSGSPKRWM